jgi:hypothetical protein
VTQLSPRSGVTISDAISPCSEERAAIDRRLAEPAVGIAGSRKAGPRSPSIPLTPAPRQIGFDDRTETKHRATILLPNPVAAHDTERGAVDGPTKFFKENRTVQNRPSLAEMAVPEFRVRCFQPRTVHYRGAQTRPGISAACPAKRRRYIRHVFIQRGTSVRRVDPSNR